MSSIRGCQEWFGKHNRGGGNACLNNRKSEKQNRTEPYLVVSAGWSQCDQKKVAKSLQQLPKKDFTSKMKDFDTFAKIALNVLAIWAK